MTNDLDNNTEFGELDIYINYDSPDVEHIELKESDGSTARGIRLTDFDVQGEVSHSIYTKDSLQNLISQLTFAYQSITQDIEEY